MKRQIDQLRKAVKILRQIGYPKRGTVEESQTLQDFADQIQREWSAEKLGQLAGDNESESLTTRMQAIGHAIEAELPEGYGFFALCFAFDDPKTVGKFVSNAKRSDVLDTMRDFIERNPMQEPGDN